MFDCPSISELRFYGCCHPCSKKTNQLHSYYKNISTVFCAEIFPYRLLGAGAYLDGGPARHLLLDGEQGHGHQLCNTG